MNGHPMYKNQAAFGLDNTSHALVFCVTVQPAIRESASIARYLTVHLAPNPHHGPVA